MTVLYHQLWPLVLSCDALNFIPGTPAGQSQTPRCRLHTPTLLQPPGQGLLLLFLATCPCPGSAVVGWLSKVCHKSPKQA